ncbi:hypothetical protein BURPS305_3082 [Burkholderia pseudomallei 305]|nr:hypothetical protein GBP346_A4196 [Burkholderia pseudomallei MSHR346]EBA47149.1 hypothetical protein BURPS305_3082 [Burkholderia pseudomallei 305]EEH30857.1 hypothetical protein BUH_4115 [Burkholderia pseudomallei Pakistan 9]
MPSTFIPHYRADACRNFACENLRAAYAVDFFMAEVRQFSVQCDISDMKNC